MTADFGTLLFTGYPYGHAVLDLYGVKACEDHGYIVITATLTGTKLSLAYILDDDTLVKMGEWLDEQHAKDYRVACQEARAEMALHDREMAQNDHLWRSF